MSPRALLLSPDDQAVSAITGVLEEMSVDCERPLDGASAAQKLNSQIYDLVLVDCDNLPAAKLIFDVCRRAHAAATIPIAIVDGRAGLPTAFRLGAELILTKPVAKDQARASIRTAVSRLKREDPARLIKAEPETVVAPAPAVATNEIPEPRAQAAAAAASASSAAPVAAPVPSVELPVETPSSSSSIPAESTSTVAAIEPPAVLPQVESPVESKPIPHETKAAAITLPESSPVVSRSSLHHEDTKHSPAELEEPAFGSRLAPDKKRKASAASIVFLLLCLAGGGFYAAWMTQPQFREIVEPQLAKLKTYVAFALPHKSAAPAAIHAQVKPSVPPVTAPAATPVVPSATTTTAPANAINAPENKTQTAAPSLATTGAISAPEKPALPATAKSEANNDLSSDNSTSTAAPAETELPWEKNTLILSSKGAEKRLVHQVQATYPAGPKSKRVEGTVVLKTLVGVTGSVTGVRLVEGDSALATAATAAVKQWRYKPYMRDGNPIPFQTIVIVDFQQP